MIEMKGKMIDQMKSGEDRDPIITHHRRLVRQGRERSGDIPRESRTGFIMGNILNDGTEG